MPLRPEWLVLYGAVAVLYLFVAWREWLSLESESARLPVWHGPALALAIGLHGALLAHGVYVEGQLRFGFAHALSATLWITAIIVWVESFFSASRGLFLLVLPLAAATASLFRVTSLRVRYQALSGCARTGLPCSQRSRSSAKAPTVA